MGHYNNDLLKCALSIKRGTESGADFEHRFTRDTMIVICIQKVDGSERSTKESLACYTDTEELYGAACRPRNRIQGLISDSPSRWFSPGLV